MMILRIVAWSSLILPTVAFTTLLKRKDLSLARLAEKNRVSCFAASEDQGGASSRRDFLDTSVNSAAAIAGASIWSPAANADTTSPICVIGANGRTGTQCVKACIDRSIPVVATSRSGVFTGDASSTLLSTTVCDVTDPSTISTAIKASRAVIFAASASKQGGPPSAVDNEGLVNVAKACIEQNVPHLVVVSSGGVSKPDSPVYKFLNLFQNIMAEKIKGEDTVRELYKGNKDQTYTIIRPGGLTEEPALGVAALELNQGDTKSGRISRADVAALCIESTLYPKLTGGATFECYNADTAKSLSSVGMSNILKQKTSENEVADLGKERRGDTWEKLFTGLDQD